MRLWLRLASVVTVALGAATAIRTLFVTWFRDPTAYGFHDWDTAASYRHQTVWALKSGALPFWDPYMCGGFPAWGYAEGAPNLVSPFLPAYLALPLLLAIRVECVLATLVALVAAYGLASCHTRSVALRGLCAVLFALNGRWALQLSVGHGWHLAYAWLPAVLWAFELALSTGRARFLLLSAGLLALQGYAGGIYPLPHTALALVAYALARAVAARELLPLGNAAVVGATAFGLFAPKLLPIAATMQRFPRLVESREAIGPSQLLAMLTAREQGVGARPVPVPAYLWHEWGIYVGWAGLAVLVLSALSARAPRGRSLWLVGAMLAALGFGAAGRLAPWTLLHHLPPFASQHVPSRFFFPAVLFLALAFASAAGRRLDGLVLRRPWVDLALSLGVALLALDLSSVGARATSHAFYLRAPDISPSAELRQAERPSLSYAPAGAWGGAALLSRLANEGVLQCAGAPDEAQPRGAVAQDDPRHRGEAFLEGDEGTARVVGRSPNGVDVEVFAEKPAVLALNMNFDPGWSADGSPALERAYAVATRVPAGRRVVRFRYVPRGLWPGVLLCLATASAWIYAGRRRAEG